MRIRILIGILSIFFISEVAVIAAEITVVYNNIRGEPGFTTDWGLSYLIRDGQGGILFDTGGSPSLLQQNLQKVGFDREKISAVVLSHYHRDHYGGLEAVLKPGLAIFLPHSFPSRFKKRLQGTGARVIEVKSPVQIAEGIWSTGEMGEYIPEQSLILKTSRGLVIITGCSHPGVDDICRRAKKLMKEKIHLVTGGFHLSGASPGKIQRIIQELKSSGVQKIAPNHCTGSTAIRMFKKAWGGNFIPLGLGATYQVD